MHRAAPYLLRCPAVIDCPETPEGSRGVARIFIGYTDERTAIFGCQGSSMAFGSQEHLLPLMNGHSSEDVA